MRCAGTHRGGVAARRTAAGTDRPCRHPRRRLRRAGRRLAADRTGSCQPDRGAARPRRGSAGTPGACPVAAHGAGPAPAGAGSAHAGNAAGQAAAYLAQPAGKILYLPLRLLFAVCAGAQAPPPCRAFGRPERYPDALGATDGAGPPPRGGQPLRRAAPLFGAGRCRHGRPCRRTGGRVRAALSAGGYRTLCLSALPAEKEHDQPAVLSAGRAEPVPIQARGL